MMRSSQWSKLHAILSLEASNLLTSYDVQTIRLSSLHLPRPYANFAIHSYNSTRKEKKKISCISVYKYLSNHYSFVNHGFLFSCTVNSWIFLSNQVLIYFLVGLQWYDITTSLIQIPVSITKSFIGLMGPNLGSTLFSQENPYTSSYFGINPRSANWSLTRSSMGGCRNQVSAPWDGCDVDLHCLILPSCRSIRL